MPQEPYSLSIDLLCATLGGKVDGRDFTLSVSLPMGKGAIRLCRLAPFPGQIPATYPLGALLAVLDGAGGAEAPAGAAAVARAMVGRSCALSILAKDAPEWNGTAPPAIAALPRWDVPDLLLLAREDRTGDLARTLVDAMPNLMRVTTPLLDGPVPALPEGATAPEIVEACLKARLPWLDVDPAHLRRVLALDWRHESLDVLGALVQLPWDWVPRDPAGRKAFTDLVTGCQPLAPRLGGYGFLRASRGRWAEFAATVARRLPPGASFGPALFAAAQGACDMADAFSRQVLLPALARANPDAVKGILQIGAARGSLRHVATLTLFSGKGLASVLELSAAWHAGHSRFECISTAALGHDAWPVPFPPMVAPNGVEMVFLGSAAALKAEGSAHALDGVPGLDHCVSGYAASLAAGDSTVASLRVPEGDTFRRLATAEMRVERDRVRVVQNQGRANLAPCREAHEAVSWLAAQVEQGSLRPSDEFLSTGWRTARVRGRTVDELCGYPYREEGRIELALAPWERFLARPLRSPDALCGTDEALAFLREASAYPRQPDTARPADASAPMMPATARRPFAGVVGVAAFAGAVPYCAGSLVGTVFLGSASGSTQANPGLLACLLVDAPRLGRNRGPLRDALASMAGGVSGQCGAAALAWYAFGGTGLWAFGAATGVAALAATASRAKRIPHLASECARAFEVRRLRRRLGAGTPA